MATKEVSNFDLQSADSVMTLHADEPKTNTERAPISADQTSSNTSPSLYSRCISHLGSPVCPDAYAELELIILTFVTGIQDATTFPDYHCFASNQTGNTVMLALSVVMPTETQNLFVPANIGVSLVCFLFGSWLTGQLGNHVFGPLNRPFILVCNFIQTLLVFATAAIQFTYGVHLEGTTTIILIALLAFASGSQVVISRSLHMTEISTAMATAAWVDLVIDPQLVKIHNRPRNRRLCFLAALVCGAFTGAGIYVKMGSAFALLISAIGKSVVMMMFFFNSAARAKTVDVAQKV